MLELEDDFILAEGDWLDPEDYTFQVHRRQEPPVLPKYQFVEPTRIQREARLLADELEYLAESSAQPESEVDPLEPLPEPDE